MSGELNLTMNIMYHLTLHNSTLNLTDSVNKKQMWDENTFIEACSILACFYKHSALRV